MMMKTALMLFTTLLLLSPLHSWGQFKKYRSKTKFAPPEKKGEIVKETKDLLPTTPTKQGSSLKARMAKKDSKSRQSRKQIIAPSKKPADIFGRNSSGISKIRKTKDSAKFVNLNPETAFGPEVVTNFEFNKTSLTEITKHMQKLVGINLILDKELKGKITILAPTPITVGDAWKAYLTALNLNGYTLVKSGSFYKIVKSRDIRYTPTKIYTGTYTPNTENYVMRILPLKNINSSEISRSFRPFLSRYGRIIDIKQTNTVIVQDTGSNINRLVRLIDFLDVPGHEESLQIIKVKHSSAQEIAGLLDKILSSKSAKGSRRSRKKEQDNITKIIAEPRTNSIIAMANAEGAKQLKNLIKKLDVKLIASSSNRIHVYYLNHGDAETLSKTLSSLVSGSGSSTKGSSRLRRRSSSSSGNELFNGQVKVTADKDNNAIVVTASPTDYLTIKEVIRKLDIARDQVYVEGLIMETLVKKEEGLGVSIVGAYGSGGASRAGFGNTTGIMNLFANNYTSLGNLFIGAGAGKKITMPIGGQQVEINSVNGLITAVATDSNTNVLAAPQIMALDNTEAIFEVGETVPTPEKTNASNGSSTVSIKEQKVALTLKITPQINKVTRFIKLKIDQKIDDFSSRKVNTTEGVGTTTRSTITTIVVRDRDTIAMGGLMRDKETHTEAKVPLLGDIPIIGWLFKNSVTVSEKVNLLFFLTPKIIAPYQKNTAETVKDLLNRRASHLKKVFADNDPFKRTAKGLYSKATQQGKAPLYDERDAKRFLQENHLPGIRGNETIEMEEEEEGPMPEAIIMNPPVTPGEEEFDTPDYRAIMQETQEQGVDENDNENNKGEEPKSTGV
jgi:general secretion pathway protein D